jgi:hypothetical protein
MSFGTLNYTVFYHTLKNVKVKKNRQWQLCVMLQNERNFMKNRIISYSGTLDRMLKQ